MDFWLKIYNSSHINIFSWQTIYFWENLLTKPTSSTSREDKLNITNMVSPKTIKQSRSTTTTWWTFRCIVYPWQQPVPSPKKASKCLEIASVWKNIIKIFTILILCLKIYSTSSKSVTKTGKWTQVTKERKCKALIWQRKFKKRIDIWLSDDNSIASEKSQTLSYSVHSLPFKKPMQLLWFVFWREKAFETIIFVLNFNSIGASSENSLDSTSRLLSQIPISTYLKSKSNIDGKSHF